MIPNSPNYLLKNCMSDSKENFKWILGSERIFKKQIKNTKRMLSLFLVTWYTQGISLFCAMIIFKVIVTDRDILGRFLFGVKIILFLLLIYFGWKLPKQMFVLAFLFLFRTTLLHGLGTATVMSLLTEIQHFFRGKSAVKTVFSPRW